MEKVIVCPHCGSEHHCFEEMQEDFSSFMCFQCGFMSDSRFNEEYDSDASKNMAIVMNQMKHFDDERKIWWYPSVVNMGKLGMIYPEGTPNDYSWRYAKLADVPEGQEEKYQGHKQFLDVENAQVFNQKEFLKACEAMGITHRLNNA